MYMSIPLFVILYININDRQRILAWRQMQMRSDPSEAFEVTNTLPAAAGLSPHK